MKISYDPQIVTINDDTKLKSVRRGFILYDPENSSPPGRRILTVVSALPDGNYAVKCHYFEKAGEDQHGITWTEVQVLGFLTQDGFDALEVHDHANCTTQLELRIE